MTAVLVFDGDCAFCSSSARWAQRWAPSRRAGVVAWQRADLDALGLTAEECSAALRWVDGERHSAGPEAIADYLRTARAPWPVVGALLALKPVTALAWPAYRWVATHRHQLPGGTPACALPATPPGPPNPDSSNPGPSNPDPPNGAAR